MLTKTKSSLSSGAFVNKLLQKAVVLSLKAKRCFKPKVLSAFFAILYSGFILSNHFCSKEIDLAGSHSSKIINAKFTIPYLIKALAINKFFNLKKYDS